MVYAYTPISSQLVYSVALWWQKNPKFCHFLDSAFVVSPRQRSEKVEHRCTTTNVPLSNSVKIVSVLQCLHDEIVRTILMFKTVTYKQTDRQTKNLMFLVKNLVFLVAWTAGEIQVPPNLAWWRTSSMFFRLKFLGSDSVLPLVGNENSRNTFSLN